jgi:septal ring factor EnvC (AmiA/AmiB activator)
MLTSHYYSHYQNNDALEVEMLQTDIMRFMAILGFCLMAIFALVQSIPTVAKQKIAQTNNAQNSKLLEESKKQYIKLEKEIVLAKKNNQYLKKKLLQTENTHSQLQSQLKQKTIESEKKLQQIEQSQQLLSNSQTEKKLLQAKLLRIQQDKINKEQQLKKITRQLKQHKENNLNQLLKVQQENKPSKGGLLKKVGLTKKLMEVMKNKKTVKKANKESVKNNQKTNKQQTLSIESPESLKQLIKTGELSLFWSDSKQLYQLNSKQYNFIKVAQLPSVYYQMDQDKVPVEFLRKSGLIGNVGKANSHWYVSLTKQLQQQVWQYQSSEKDKDLYINNSGKINLN